MPRGVKSYTDEHARFFGMLANRDRLAIYGCLHKQGTSTLPQLADLIGWNPEDGSPDNQALRRHLKELHHWGVVSRVEDENLWLSDEDALKELLLVVINDLCR